MAVEKGKEWGHPGLLPPSTMVASSDAEANELLAGGELSIGLEAGDLARTLGIRQPYDPVSPKQLVPIDAVSVELDDGSVHIGLAHVLLGHPVASRQSVAIMNAAFWHGRNIAPRAHPGDGKLDVVHLQLSAADRIKAWRRMTSGSHVPHPAISIRRVPAGQAQVAKRRSVWVDGRRIGRSMTVAYQVIPEAITVGVS